MRITRLRVRNLRRHLDLSVEFAPGLNVVCGPNEAGKSTLQRGIEMGLFRKATSTSQELGDLRAWDAASGADPQVELDFDDDGTPGRLLKTFAGSQGTVSLELGDQTLTDPSQVDQAMVELTGLPSEKFYRSTAGVRHQDIANLDTDDGGLRDQLQKSMSGADRGTWQAKRALEDQIRQYRLDGPKNAGPLRRTRDEIARVHAELTQGEGELSRLERDRAALATAHAKRAELDERHAREEAQLTMAEHALALLAQEAEAQELYERYRRVSELRAETARLDGSHPAPMPLAELKRGVDGLRAVEFRISELRAERASQPDPSAYEAARVPSGWGVWTLVGVLFVAAAVAAFALLTGVPAVALGGALAAAGLLSVVRGVRLRLRAVNVRRSNRMLESEVDRRVKGRSVLDDQFRAAEREREAVLGRLGVADLSAAELLLIEETEHSSAIERLRAEERGLIGDRPVDGDAAELRDAAAAQAAQARHALSGLGEAGADPKQDRVRARAAVEATRTQRDAALGEEGQARGRVDANEVDAERVAGAAERLAEAEDRLALLERRLRIYEQTLAAIEAAEQQTMQKAARFLERGMGRDVALLTDGRYRRICVDEQTLAFTVYSAERGDWIPATQLSRGTLDQLYLAARLGLVRQLTGDRQPPLILDDPFVTFDDDRARRALTLLKQLAADFQVIYLTCSDRYDTLADKVIELPQPTARDRDEESDGAAAAEPGAADGASTAPRVTTRSPSDPPTPAAPSIWDQAQDPS
jgi:ABC-type hemin transport system ATPase subunit